MATTKSTGNNGLAYVPPSVGGLGGASIGTNGSGGVTISGLASGLNDSQIVTALVGADSAQLNSYKTDLTNAQAAVTTISGIGTALAGLSSAVQSLSTQSAVSGFTATSNNYAVSATAGVGSVPGNFELTVQSLATAQQTLSAPIASATTPVGGATGGSIQIQVGAGKATTVSVTAKDTLATLVQKINASGAAVSASTFFDGSQYRLEISGTSTGKANSITFTETGTSLDLSGKAGTGQTLAAASDAALTIGNTVNGVFSGVPITSASNVVTQAIPGVALTLSQTTTATAPVTVSVAPSVNTLATNLQNFVNSYNAVVTQIQGATGYGSTKADNPLLAGNGGLQSITQALTQTLNGNYGSGSYRSLATIGLAINDTGLLSLDTNMLSAAFTANPAAVETLLAPTSTNIMGGAMTAFQTTMFRLTDPTIGAVATETSQFSREVTSDQNSILTQQDMLNQYQAQLQKAFSSMETTYSSSKSLSNQLTQSLG